MNEYLLTIRIPVTAQNKKEVFKIKTYLKKYFTQLDFISVSKDIIIDCEKKIRYYCVIRYTNDTDFIIEDVHAMTQNKMNPAKILMDYYKEYRSQMKVVECNEDVFNAYCNSINVYNFAIKNNIVVIDDKN